MDNHAVNLAEKFQKVDRFYSPRIVARLNDYDVKIVRLKGDFVWHKHDDTDELFLVIEGSLRIDLRGGSVTLAPGELYVVPRGVEHKPFARDECRALLLEPAGVVNTGDAEKGELTAQTGEWI
jgi:mannose-6-phosphate isomerase-like protein (cupin superfamily)